MADVLCLGEILVDWVCTTQGAELDQAQTFTKAAGGAPANTAVGLSRQGVSVGFIGHVSADAFGNCLKSILARDRIDTAATISDPEAQTRMAYVVTTATGDRKLAEFSRIACADARLQAEDLKVEQFSQAAVLHFGSISQIENPARDATQRAIELARASDLLISYDPNVRLGLWPSPAECKDRILKTMSLVDLVKINEDELLFLTGSKDHSFAEQLRKEHNLALLIITLDARGAYIVTESGSRVVPGFSVKLVEATGAGDGFNSGVLAGLLPSIKPEKNRRQALAKMDLSQLSEIVKRANAVGALTCTRAGAIPALPTTEEIAVFMGEMAAAAQGN